METVNHECYVSLELAKLLKEADFDWECRGYFDGIEFHPNGSVECTNYNSNTCKYLKAPTIDVAQRWLREVKNIDTLIRHTHDAYAFSLGNVSRDIEVVIPAVSIGYCTYEEAQEAGIKKALEIILEKGE